MDVKKYEEVKTIQDLTPNKMRKYLIIELIGIITLGILGIYACISAINLSIKYEALKIENNELVKANEIKDSIITDLQEDNMKLQEMIK